MNPVFAESIFNLIEKSEALFSLRSMKLSIGIDYGTNSVRALVADCSNGAELGTEVYHYKRGQQGVIIDEHDANLARQSPDDYIQGLCESVRGAIKKAKERHPEIVPQDFIGIGVDSTGSSPIPVAKDNSALAQNPEFAANPNAQCWLWKDHTSFEEALKITELARKHRPQFIAKCGGTYSSEWWWSKIWHCENVDKKVFDAAYSWVELADWIPSVLAGVKDPCAIVRGVCAAGHKAMYSEEWGGLPDAEFLAMLAPEIAELRGRLYETAHSCDKIAGKLCAEWAEKLELLPGLPIAVGEFDVHYGAIGCGVRKGTLVRAVGTSTCDCSVWPLDENLPDIPGICGIVKGAILPNCYGLEAGQSAVGDLFKWFIETVLGGDGSTFGTLRAEAEKMLPGESGLVALDWNNGNRTVLVDQRLTGLMMGQTLHTKPHEIYRALIEATGFGAKMIMERFEEFGVKIDRIVCCGGIAEKDVMTMQIYADIADREIFVSRSAQTCALGAAVAGAVMGGAHKNYADAQSAMTAVKEISYKPIPENVKVYAKLFAIYKKLHDAFGGVKTENLGSVMKELLAIKESQKNEIRRHQS